MRPIFREDKATQVASRLLEMADGEMSVLQLVKLMYFVDRLSLQRHGRTVTMDHFYAMKHGPVVSSAMDCINATTDEEAPIWSQYISRRERNTVRLHTPAEPTELSPADEEIIHEVFAEHGTKSVGQLIAIAHELPEWEDPAPEKRRVMKYGDVLRALGWSEEDVRFVVHDLRAEVRADLLFE